jgi:hypothetical protein
MFLTRNQLVGFFFKMLCFVLGSLTAIEHLSFLFFPFVSYLFLCCPFGFLKFYIFRFSPFHISFVFNLSFQIADFQFSYFYILRFNTFYLQIFSFDIFILSDINGRLRLMCFSGRSSININIISPRIPVQRSLSIMNHDLSACLISLIIDSFRGHFCSRAHR